MVLPHPRVEILVTDFFMYRLFLVCTLAGCAQDASSRSHVLGVQKLVS